MTIDFDEYYGVTVHHAEPLAPRRYRANAEIFRRDAFKVLARVVGEGATRNAADGRAVQAARDWVSGKPTPSDWKVHTAELGDVRLRGRPSRRAARALGSAARLWDQRPL